MFALDLEASGIKVNAAARGFTVNAMNNFEGRRSVEEAACLAQLDAKSSQAAEYWPDYVRTWSMWNHVRTLAPLASATFGAVFLAA